MPNRTFLYGALVLLASNLLNRILGFVYQYLIMSHIGGEALGLFNMVFPVYMMALVLTTAGIPLALSKIVAEEISKGNYHHAKAIFHLALKILCLSGLAISALLYLIVTPLSDKLFSDPRVLQIFRICIPAIFIVSIASAFRGYFQGIQNMFPTAVSQICEQLVRVSLGFTLALRFLNRGAEWAAAGLALGMLAGETVGLLVIVAQYLYRRNALPAPPGSLKAPPQTLSRLFNMAYPVTLGRLLSTGISSVDAVVIPQRLMSAGFAARAATTLFGQLGGSALTLLSFPSVFTNALATSLVPSISEAAAQNHMQTVRSQAAEAIRLTIILSLPCLLVIFYFAEPLTLFFKSPALFPVLRILTLGGLFTYLQQTTSGILQGLGKMHLPVIHSVIAAVLRFPVLYILTGLPAMNLKGVAFAYVLGSVIVAVLNIHSIIKYSGLAVDLPRFVLQPLSAGTGMFILFHLMARIPLSPLPSALVTLLPGCSAYLFILYQNGGISRSDLRYLPWIGKRFR